MTGRQTKTKQGGEEQREDFVFYVISLGLTHHATDLTENNADTSWPISNRALWWRMKQIKWCKETGWTSDVMDVDEIDPSSLHMKTPATVILGQLVNVRHNLQLGPLWLFGVSLLHLKYYFITSTQMAGDFMKSITTVLLHADKCAKKFMKCT